MSKLEALDNGAVRTIGLLVLSMLTKCGSDSGSRDRTSDATRYCHCGPAGSTWSNK